MQVFAAIVDEFGSTLNSTVENSCMSSILSYMAVAPGTGKHAPFKSWFYWCVRRLHTLGDIACAAAAAPCPSSASRQLLGAPAACGLPVQ